MTSTGTDMVEIGANGLTFPYDFVVLEGVSHWIPEQAAPTFTPLLLNHLAANGSLD